ncbi:MAG: hypothetical protein LBQ66_04485 [Planctomycetaceae bacterium]|jgi:hypothetical protein|nr:hypothetical protein [Planctomycetaceae bacterium]
MNKKHFVSGCIIAFLLILPLITYSFRRHQEVMIDNADYKQTDQFVQTHLGRTAEQIKMLQKEDIKQSFENLIDSQQYSYPGYFCEVKGASIDLETLLSTRRFLKIFQQFQKLNNNQSEIYLKDFSEQAVKDFEDSSQYILSQQDNSISAKRKINMMGAKYKICTAMLLAANKGDGKKVAELFQNMNSTIERTLEHIESKKNLFDKNFAGIIKSIMSLDKDCILSIIIYTSTVKKLNLKNITELKDKLIKKEIPLVNWEAQNTYYDILHQQSYFAIDKSAIFDNFNVYYIPSGSSDITNNFEAIINTTISNLKNN